MSDKPLGYLGGDIMTRGSNLAREEEYQKFIKASIPGEVYSPVQNKSINDKSNMTEEENNCLAEKVMFSEDEDGQKIEINFENNEEKTEKINEYVNLL